MTFIHKGKELDSCIVSKAKHALTIKKDRPGNNTRCTPAYWAMTVRALGEHYHIENELIVEAINKYDSYFNADQASG
ncbi:hypothetical protein [Spirosoma sp. KNUC1025]|uniref:hypothetical protein n=1 Tax=Spirosoma sp. KNUC1025 TaxID=2894082 RepID=UPI00386BE308|nr:hypothetical protein LN737_11165 [Spirosoma sp. KNUC1025]